MVPTAMPAMAPLLRPPAGDSWVADGFGALPWGGANSSDVTLKQGMLVLKAVASTNC